MKKLVLQSFLKNLKPTIYSQTRNLIIKSISTPLTISSNSLPFQKFFKFNNNRNNEDSYNKNSYNNIRNIGIGTVMIVGIGYIICQECFEENDTHVTQIKTGFNFPKILNKDENIYYKLASIGNRKINFINVSLYSLGLYVNSDVCKAKLPELIVMGKEEFCKNRNDVKQKILEKNIGLAIKIRPIKRVNWEHFYNGLQNTLVTIMLKNYNMNLQEIEDVLLELKSVMDTKMEIPITAQIDFVKREGNGNCGNLIVLYNEKPIKEIKDPRLSNALFEFYLGEYSKTKDARDQFYENLWKLLREESTTHHKHFSN